eukprot:1158696-Pelagomonas_calceolata.AAC.11
MPGCVPLCQCAFSGASMRALTPACVLLYQHACFYASMAATMSGASMPATIVAWRERKSVLPFFPLNASINVAFACICVMRTFKEQKIVLFLPSCGLNINIISKMNTMFARVCCVPQEMRASVLRVALGLCAEAPDTRMLTAIPLLLAVNCTSSHALTYLICSPLLNPVQKENVLENQAAYRGSAAWLQQGMQGCEETPDATLCLAACGVLWSLCVTHLEKACFAGSCCACSVGKWAAVIQQRRRQQQQQMLC